MHACHHHVLLVLDVLVLWFCQLCWPTSPPANSQACIQRPQRHQEQVFSAAAAAGAAVRLQGVSGQPGGHVQPAQDGLLALSRGQGGCAGAAVALPGAKVASLPAQTVCR
jgi:hypothetical protein